ncbi:glucose-1-phosphate adenylyltransferase [Plasticicumulans sp.]|uniref:glucose-1-phosphate adenylyltransferase n=1 Tax=Plasticicumulans sp. TaxID=2307179 RepID=UPI000F92A10A|nr:glucose-1-phosphate adenylyltransferase [Plasticicumulans sp.]MBS0601036.1 glucose-1-phosphate adenylyltransferase [Pseudomonadota bacterium]RTL00138.1 MAG: glucose-1-phosphate adenylyltransferase [Xanthomonadales bacterium]HMW29171.1 glucose-1-phosphate adenylyltransferase [Plasticicumulans sp.]HMW42015.1 glucose-1-phosphate adenylyltransferase [Plasticicumulans sp.]HMZ10101.1 glucose-1-phosphate adenylyltransferase [Plasticicumulans sp.]
MENQTATPRYVSRLTRETMALVLAGGRGTRLYELTQWRAKPAVYFGGKFRIIDFPLSNCVNSGIQRIGVLTQYKAHSLIRHLIAGWGSVLSRELGGGIEILPASQRTSDDWYAGTADAIYQNLDILRVRDPSYILVLSGDHIYKMDYGPMIAAHVESGAAMTVSCIEIPLAEASSFGIISVDAASRVTAFNEKPQQADPMPGRTDVALGSMGNYVFNTEFLFEKLIEDAKDPNSSHDFGKDVIPAIIRDHHVHAYLFRDPATGRLGYWRDVGTVDAFWEANIELAAIQPELNLYDHHWPILTYQSQLPPAKFVFEEPGRTGSAPNSLVSGGCLISGATVRHSVLFSNVRVMDHALVEDAVILPDVVISPGARIRRAVIDRGCTIPEGMVIGEDLTQDAKQFRVTQRGIVLVTKEMLGQGRVP